MLDPDKKERILEAATEIFRRYGYRKSSVDEIAGTAGVGKGTLYMAWDSKEDLFYAVLYQAIRELAATISKTIDPREPADELLVGCALDLFAAFRRDRLLGDLVTGELDDALPWGDEVHELRAIGRRNTVEIVELGVRQELFRDDLEAEAVSRVVEDLLIAALILGRKGLRTDDEQQRLALTAIDLVLNGVKVRD